MRTIILAPNLMEACIVAKQEGLPPRQSREWSYGGSAHALHGLGPDTRFLISTRWLGGPKRMRAKKVLNPVNGEYIERMEANWPQEEALAVLRARYPDLDVKYVTT